MTHVEVGLAEEVIRSCDGDTTRLAELCRAGRVPLHGVLTFRASGLRS